MTMTYNTMTYNDKLDANDQITMEEQISSIIADQAMSDRLTEEECNHLGRNILLMVLTTFRPDLVDEQSPATKRQ